MEHLYDIIIESSDSNFDESDGKGKIDKLRMSESNQDSFINKLINFLKI